MELLKDLLLTAFAGMTALAISQQAIGSALCGGFMVVVFLAIDLATEKSPSKE